MDHIIIGRASDDGTGRAFIPVFIKRKTNEWRLVEMFERIGEKRSPKYIAPHAKKSGREDITRVIYLRQVDA